MYEAIRIPNIDEILMAPEEAPRTDPIDENMSIMYGKPIKAFPEQDHDSHIAVHIQFLQDPSLAGNPAAQGLQPVLIAHIAEHIALLYRQRMESSIGMPLPSLPNIRDPKFKLEDINPEMDMLISQRAAQVVQAAPQMAPIRALQQAGQQGQDNPLQYAQQLAQLEAQSMQMRTQSEIAADQAKAQSDIQIDQAKAKQQIDIAQAKLQAELEAKVRKLEADLQIEREKNAVKLQMEMNKDG
jgi:Skp family chaperone for outer membrane proteins